MSQGRDSSVFDCVPVLAAVKLCVESGWDRGLTAAALRRGSAGQEESRRVRFGSGGGRLLVLGRPGTLFVVAGVCSQATVQDAHQAVGESAEGLVVGGAAGSVLVVERAGSR